MFPKSSHSPFPLPLSPLWVSFLCKHHEGLRLCNDAFPVSTWVVDSALLPSL
jgi:hypothetical protein